MKKLLKAVLTGSLLGLTVLGLAGCGGQSGSSSSGGSVPKDTIVVGMAVDPETLDPAVTMDNKGWQITYPAYERLVKYKVADGKPPRRWNRLWPSPGPSAMTDSPGPLL